MRRPSPDGSEQHGGGIGRNSPQFLIDREGRVVDGFDSKDDPPRDRGRKAVEATGAA